MSRQLQELHDNSHVEGLLDRLGQGDKDAMTDLLPLLLDDLRRLAKAQRRRLGAGETLCTTALIHEAYLKLHHSSRMNARTRHHFLHTCALAMRQILIDHARSRLAARERQQIASMPDEGIHARMHQQASLVLDIDTALNELQDIDPRLVNVVNYRFFAGYDENETADLLGVSQRTVRRDWFKAKVWLADKLGAHDVTAITVQ